MHIQYQQRQKLLQLIEGRTWQSCEDGVLESAFQEYFRESVPVEEIRICLKQKNPLSVCKDYLRAKRLIRLTPDQKKFEQARTRWSASLRAQACFFDYFAPSFSGVMVIMALVLGAYTLIASLLLALPAAALCYWWWQIPAQARAGIRILNFFNPPARVTSRKHLILTNDQNKRDMN